MKAALAVVALAVTGCSTFTSFGAGPATTLAGSGHATGVGFEVGRGVGGSSETSTVFAEIRGRGLITSDQQQGAVLAGFSNTHWFTPSIAMWGGLDTGFGIGATDDRLFFEQVFQARLLSALVLHETESVEKSSFAAVTFQSRRRETTLLTIGVSGDANVRFTRESYGTFQLLIGLAFMEQDGLPLKDAPR